jgi:hypothetical protein
VSTILYRNITLDMSPSWQRLRALANSSSPFKHKVKNLRITFRLQDFGTQLDTINFGTATANIAAFIQNCSYLKQILEQYTDVKTIELDLTALCPFDNDDDATRSLKSVMNYCYSQFISALLPLRNLVDKRRTSIALRIRHPKTVLSVQSLVDENSCGKVSTKIFLFMRHLNVTRLEVGVDNECTFSWLWLFTQLEHLCLRQSHNSIYEDYSS